jgi:hypothetical protein
LIVEGKMVTWFLLYVEYTRNYTIKVAHSYNPTTQEVETERILFQSQPPQKVSEIPSQPIKS